MPSSHSWLCLKRNEKIAGNPRGDRTISAEQMKLLIPLRLRKNTQIAKTKNHILRFLNGNHDFPAVELHLGKRNMSISPTFDSLDISRNIGN